MNKNFKHTAATTAKPVLDLTPKSLHPAPVSPLTGTFRNTGACSVAPQLTNTSRLSFVDAVDSQIALSTGLVGIILLDIRRFRWVINTFGFSIAEIALDATATRMRAVLDKSEALYRLGGDVFAVLLRNMTDSKAAKNLAYRLQTEVSQPIICETCTFTLRTYISIAYAPAADTDADTLISRATAALHEAKRRKHQSQPIIATEQNTRQDDRALAFDLPGALKNGEFHPVFQPQVNLATGDLEGVEALARWQHPQRGPISPDQFLPVAQSMSLVDQIDRSMLQMCAQAVQRLETLGHHIPSLSINLSEARLLDPRLATDIGCLWRSLRCKLSFEVLETINFDDAVHQRQLSVCLNTIRRMGTGIAIDDFGSGYASMTALLHIKPDNIKIDRTLVKDICTSEEKRKVVQAIIKMADTLDIYCIAEGAESASTLDLLRTLGCRAAQGFAISKPLSEDALATYLTNRDSKRQAGAFARAPSDL